MSALEVPIVRKLLWMFAIALGCGTEDDPAVWNPVTARSASLDAGAARGVLDASSVSQLASDAGSACASIDVCMDQKPFALYNVCFSGTAGGALPSTKACVVGPNGALYLIALSTGRVVLNLGWTQSGSAAGSTLSPENEARCAEARQALVVDASTPSPCAAM